MALDMKLSESALTSEIHHHEEQYLVLIEAYDLPCPILYRIWEQFYDGPRISPTDSALIVQELTGIDRFIKSERPESIDSKKWAASFAKLTKFFMEASSTKSTVQCISD